MNVPTKEISILVIEVSPGGVVPEGARLTGNGKYHYTFTPSSAIVTESHTKLRYYLDSESVENYEITKLTSNDSFDQLSAPKVHPDGSSVSVMDKNSQAETINVTVWISDRTKGVEFGCDPEVTNKPPKVLVSG